MKKLLCLSALVTGLVQANELQLSDLNYFQKQSSVLLNSSINSTDAEARIINDITNSSSYTDQKAEGRSWSNRLTYGVRDNLTIGLEFDYALSYEVNQTTSSGNRGVPYDDAGFSDPKIGFGYRIQNQDIYIDLIGALVLKSGDKENGSASTTKSVDGNNKQGHNSLELGIEFGKKIDRLEWRAGAGLDYGFSGSYKNLDEDGGAPDSWDSESYLNLNIFGQLQYRLDQLALGFGFAYTNYGDRSNTLVAGGTKEEAKFKSFSTIVTSVTARYDVSSQLVLNAGFGLLMEYDNDYTYFDGSSTSKGQVAGNKASVVSIGATILF